MSALYHIFWPYVLGIGLFFGAWQYAKWVYRRLQLD